MISSLFRTFVGSVGVFCVIHSPPIVSLAKPALDTFAGKHYRGVGDIEHLRFLEISRRMFEPDPELQNLTMLYEPKWNGFVEGPTWDAWWIQNSYGTTYSILPFLQEPLTTFLQNSHDLWFDQMGDGKRVGAAAPFDWIAPDGCLCDAARPGFIIYKQGDGRTAIHDWGMEFTAAGLLLQSESLLISRDAAMIGKYLPKLERCARFIESRRDPKNNLFFAGPAANLLAPSFAGWKKPDGSYDKSYLTGLSITYIAALDRLIELEKLAGRTSQEADYVRLRDTAKTGLQRLATDEGYFIRSLDPDGVKHGVFGSAIHGYFEASPNHDAIAFRVVDDAQAERIMEKIEAIPELRPYDFILPNYPSYDDLYEEPVGLWSYGTWVNGGHWSTCEARMILAYYRLGKFEDARRSIRRLHTFAEKFRMDNPLTHRGSQVYQPNQPVNLCYDTLGPAAAFLRGLFEYRYDAVGLTLVPHLPDTLVHMDQLDPVRFGTKQVLISAIGQGPITRVKMNGLRWKTFNATSVFLPYDKTPPRARVEITLGKGLDRSGFPGSNKRSRPVISAPDSSRMPMGSTNFNAMLGRLERFINAAGRAGLGHAYETAHARLAMQCIRTSQLRAEMRQCGLIKPLPPPSQQAADQLYIDAADRLFRGLEKYLTSPTNST
ncbi:MAG TPA: hypothetical protein P5055_10510, partial [Candidatus Paceibacterota bacterium]|nr:hypothetical protein [Candidatus Paceibacterota bacterium]